MFFGARNLVGSRSARTSLRTKATQVWRPDSLGAQAGSLRLLRFALVALLAPAWLCWYIHADKLQAFRLGLRYHVTQRGLGNCFAALNSQWKRGRPRACVAVFYSFLSARSRYSLIASMTK